MEQPLSHLQQWLADERLFQVVRALTLVIAGLILSRLASSAVGRLAQKRLDKHQLMLMRRGVFYGLLVVFLLAALHQLGFNLGVLLGAAGIVSVAVGFASQTSASNLISGLFLVGERPFSVGDVIQVGNTTGEVLSIDLLSVKLRTFDNLFVRIPNESLIKSEVTTLTRFPIRRFDLLLGVAYKEDLRRVEDVLLRVADANPLCLVDPEPLMIFQGFGESSQDLQFSVWSKRENFLKLKNSLAHEIKQAFDAQGIEIPFPHRSLYTGEATKAMPVRLVTSEDDDH